MRAGRGVIDWFGDGADHTTREIGLDACDQRGGDVRKLGLFPALAAASLSATTLLKEDSTFFLWAPVILACCFYLIAFHAFSQRERPEQVIALLEYAVQYADEPVK